MRHSETVSQRLLGEMHYVDQQSQGTELTDEDRSYRQRQQERYEQLRS